MSLCFPAMCSGEFPVEKEPKGPLMMNLDPPFKTPADNSSNIINREQLPIAGAKYSNTIGVSLNTDKPGYSSACNLVWPGVANTFVDSFNEPNSEGKIRHFKYTNHSNCNIWCYGFHAAS